MLTGHGFGHSETVVVVDEPMASAYRFTESTRAGLLHTNERFPSPDEGRQLSRSGRNSGRGRRFAFNQRRSIVKTEKTEDGNYRHATDPRKAELLGISPPHRLRAFDARPIAPMAG